jgi:hypothetical protein
VPKIRMPIEGGAEPGEPPFTAGMRDAQLAIERPHGPKIANGAFHFGPHHRRVSPAEILEEVRAMGIPCRRSSRIRFDRTDSTTLTLNHG